TNQDHPRSNHHTSYPSAYPSASLGNGERRPSQTTCYSCGEIGHVSRYCPNRPSNDARITAAPNNNQDETGKEQGRQQ
ncbi:hypothetical protein A0J61_10937, partial [Choanephora cucurbitarum]